MINKKLLGLQDARSTRGILSRGPARYGNMNNTAKPSDLRTIARRRLKEVNQRRIGARRTT